jgi:HSP20 family molecular chaperone IbpA
MNLTDQITSKTSSIRHHIDHDSLEFYYSIIDVIDILGLSKDSRNYWKVLKSRLKNTHTELVTDCNQTKMISSDGKYYLTDTAKIGTVLQIVEVISPTKVPQLRIILDKIERENSVNYFSNDNYTNEDKKISTVISEEGEISVDIYKKDNSIFVKTMIAGVDPGNIFISLDCKTLVIKVNRVRDNSIKDSDYNFQELQWGKFGKIITLPFEVDIDNVITTFQLGILSIELPVLDKTRTKIIKVK